jgi:NADH:ubiquinone oxidoreductase subunit 5 (subunit L)/multisubunit Na+/H+ antiporter MnhA subunit
LIENKYYVDEIYHHSVIRGTVLLSEVLSWIDVHIIDGVVNLTRHITLFLFGHGSNLFDQFVVDGVVNGSAAIAKRSSTLLRRAQSGFVQNYALVMGAGVILLVAVYLVTRP